MAERYKKVPELARILLNVVRIPNLIETSDEQTQRELVEKYFDAWTTQSVELVTDIFAQDAIYDDKPGKKESMQGIEAIQDYWKTNPLSQRNIHINYRIAGFSADNSVWSEFSGNFDVDGQRVNIKGVIKFTIDFGSRKVTRLTEYFTTEKTPTM